MSVLGDMPQTFVTNEDFAGIPELVKHARRPAILAGIGAVRTKCRRLASGPLAEQLGCPVVVSPKAKGGPSGESSVFPLGTLDMACHQVIWKLLQSSDLILAVGFDAVELIKPWPLKTPVLHIDTTPNTDQVYAADIEVVGSIPAILASLTPGRADEPRWSESEVRQHRETLCNAYYAGRVPGKLNPTDVVDAVRDALPQNTIVTTDVGSHKLLVGQGWPAYEPLSVLMSNGMSSMGFGLPSSMTAKLLHPDRPVVCFTGDGGMGMVQSELQLASSLKLGLIVVVFCDNSLNKDRAQADGSQVSEFRHAIRVNGPGQSRRGHGLRRRTR